MTRHDFSYWLTITGNPDELAAADTILHDLGVVPDYLLPDIDSTETNIARYNVGPDSGTIEEWPSAAETIGKLADGHPDLQIILDCVDEEDHVCSSKHVWYQGKYAESHGCLYLPDDDLLLIKAIKGERAFTCEQARRVLQSLSKGTCPEVNAILQAAIISLRAILISDGVFES